MKTKLLLICLFFVGIPAYVALTSCEQKSTWGILSLQDGSQINIHGYKNFNALCDSSDNNWFIINGNVIAKEDVVAFEFCNGFNTNIINGGFLKNCINFNSHFTIPSKVTEIDNEFLYGCINFNQDIYIPNNIEKLELSFLYNVQSMTSIVNINNVVSFYVANFQPFPHALCMSKYNCPAISQGIKITGKYATDCVANYLENIRGNLGNLSVNLIVI